MPIGLMELVVIGVIAFVIYITIKRSSVKKDGSVENDGSVLKIIIPITGHDR